MSSCKRAKVWGDFIDGEGEARKVFTLACGCWACPECAREMAANLRGLVTDALKGYLEERGRTAPMAKYEMKLLTLTLPGREWREKTGREAGEKILKKNLNRLLQMLRKHFNLKHYLWVKEYQQDGFAHAHVLLLGKVIAGKEILDFIRLWWCGRYGMGNIDLKVINTLGGAVGYLLKYLTKGTSEGLKKSKVFSLSTALRALVGDEMKRRKDKGKWELIRLGRMNPDGSYGPVIWEKGAELNPFEAEGKRILQELLDFFENKSYKGEQIRFDVFENDLNEK